MLDKETRDRLIDFFSPAELVEYVGIDSEELLFMIEEYYDLRLSEALPDLEEMMGVRGETP